MDRETFFARPSKPKTIDIPLGEARGEEIDVVKARKLTQQEVEVMRKKYGSESTALEGLRYVVSRCVVNDDGERVFKDEDMQKLLGVDFDVLQEIANAVLEFSGLHKPVPPKKD